MKTHSKIACLALLPNIAFAHEGIDPGSVLHTIAHFGESYGALLALPVALAVVVGLKRRRAGSRSAGTE